MNPPIPLRILVAGASGLVGQGVWAACRSAPDVVATTALVRRAGSIPGADEMVLADFSRAHEASDAMAGHQALFYCVGALPLGTPEAEYRRVTIDLTLAVAQAYAQANPDGCFLYVSGANANAGSRIMPLRVKGEIEQVLSTLPIRTVMLRPGGVRPVSGTGTAHALMKPFYLVARPFMRLAQALAPSLVTSNRSIGRAMLALARLEHPPLVVECADINRLGR